tara:strand:- start:102 stop:734 length:633 start_codon:yes stop_codon:yes gene_type:complete
MTNQTKLSKAVKHATNWVSETNSHDGTLKTMAGAAIKDIGKDAHLVYLSPNGKKGKGLLSKEAFNELKATLCAKFGGEWAEDFASMVTADHKAYIALDSASKKKMVSWKGKQVTAEKALDKAKNEVSSRMTKLNQWLDPEFEGVVGRSAKIKDESTATRSKPEPQTPKTSADKQRAMVDSIKKLIENDEYPNYNPEAQLDLLAEFLTNLK